MFGIQVKDIKRAVKAVMGNDSEERMNTLHQSTVLVGEKRHYGLGTPSFKIINTCSFPVYITIAPDDNCRKIKKIANANIIDVGIGVKPNGGKGNLKLTPIPDLEFERHVPCSQTFIVYPNREKKVYFDNLGAPFVNIPFCYMTVGKKTSDNKFAIFKINARKAKGDVWQAIEYEFREEYAIKIVDDFTAI